MISRDDVVTWLSEGRRQALADKLRKWVELESYEHLNRESNDDLDTMYWLGWANGAKNLIEQFETEVMNMHNAITSKMYNPAKSGDTNGAQ